jgi:hypothetical protein
VADAGQAGNFARLAANPGKAVLDISARSGPKGRKPVETDVKNLILSMKNDNLLWGVKKIQGGLLQLEISLSTKTIRKILQAFRRRGKIRSSLTWKKFLETQIQFIYVLDFPAVDTMLGKRFYVFKVISHKTREIVQFAITENPTREFLRQQMMAFSESIAGKAYDCACAVRYD